MFDAEFLKATAERAVKTFVQSLLALMTTSQVGMIEADWMGSVGVALSATALSVLTSFGSANFGSSAGPSLLNESTHPDTVVLEVQVPVEVPAKKAPAKKAAPKK
jgi:hypothetical protein